MMAETTRLCEDHRAVGLIMSSPSPSTRKRIGRMFNKGYRRVGTVGVCHFSGAVRTDSYTFPPTSEDRPEARNHGFGFASCSRGLVFPNGDIAGPRRAQH